MASDVKRRDPLESGSSPDVLAQWKPGSDVAIVGFGAFVGSNLGAFHFIRSTRRFDVSKLYLKDSRNAWYHFGLSGKSSDIEGTKDYLQRVLDEHDVRRRILLGASSGGYAALLLGHLLEVDDVLAISPRTFLDLANRRAIGDRRLMMYALRLNASPAARREYFDICAVFARKRSVATRMSVFYDETHRIDAAHAERLREFPFVTLRAFEGGGHTLEFAAVIRDALAEWLDTTLARHVG